MKENQEPIIKLDSICYAYDGEIALRRINMEIFRGETIILQGANGSGKSTLLRLLNGLIEPEEGRYKFEGICIDKAFLKDSRRSRWFHQRMGYVFQNSDVQLFCGNVEEEIAFGPLQMGLSDQEVRRRTDDVIRMLDIENLRHRAPYHLSGGEKKKVAIACILSMNPEVLILDEPLAGLDKKTQVWLTEFLLSLKEAGKTIVIATHNEELASLLADRRFVFNDEHEAGEEKV